MSTSAVCVQTTRTVRVNNHTLSNCRNCFADVSEHEIWVAGMFIVNTNGLRARSFSLFRLNYVVAVASNRNILYMHAGNLYLDTFANKYCVHDDGAVTTRVGIIKRFPPPRDVGIIPV